MNDILRIAISAGLFRNQTVFDNENIKSAIPDNTFGVFVGIDRSAKHALLDWPNRVHGCIGYWDPDYKVMDKNLILTKMMQVSKSATWEDNRRKYFKHSIYLDLYAKYKVYFMLGPIKEIDNDGFIKETGEMFDNDKYGLIVVNANDQYQRATYLPDVFSVTDWSHIKDSLIQKADIIDPTKISFYAYDSLIVSMTLADYFVMPFNHFINHRYQEFVPHTINNNIVIIDKTDDVRNLANIYDILMMERYNYPLDETVKQSIINNIDYYINKYKHITRQATPFMMLALYTINPDHPMINIIKTDLLKQIELQNKLDRNQSVEPGFIPIDKNFEWGEILMGVLIVEPNNETLKQALAEIPKEDANLPVSRIDIFRYNWHAKLIPGISNNDYPATLTNYILAYIDKHNYSDETNYYAVEFESLSALYNKLQESPDYKLQESPDYKLIEQKIGLLLTDLEKRRTKDGLYQFKNSESRLDITCHVLNGFYSLLENSSR